jgi:hypothetical protein
MPLNNETSATELARALGQPAPASTVASAATSAAASAAPAVRSPTPPALLERAIARRRSVHAFGDQPVTGAETAAILRTARTAAPVRAGSPLEIAVAVSGGQEQRHGVYRTNEDGGLAGMVAGESLVAELRECYAPAPLLLLICGAVPAAADEYRTTLLAAASSGYTAWLAAVGIGLAGCVFGRTHGKVTDALGGASRHLFTIAIGHAARPE